MPSTISLKWASTIAEIRIEGDSVDDKALRLDSFWCLKQAFNVAIPTGAIYNHTFKHDGLYNVACDIHSGMAAVIISSSTPFTTIADPQGNFVFENVAPGLYTVTVYAGKQRLERSIDIAGARTELSIEGP